MAIGACKLLKRPNATRDADQNDAAMIFRQLDTYWHIVPTSDLPKGPLLSSPFLPLPELLFRRMHQPNLLHRGSTLPIYSGGSTKARCPLGRFEAMGSAAAGELYQFSGFNTVDPILATTRCDAYNPVSNTWRSITSIPQATTHAGQVPDTDQPANQTFWLARGFLGNSSYAI